MACVETPGVAGVFDVLHHPSLVAAIAAVIQAQTQVTESPLQGMLQVIPLSASGTSLGLQETA